jgi:hypothetical protein
MACAGDLSMASRRWRRVALVHGQGAGGDHDRGALLLPMSSVGAMANVGGVYGGGAGGAGGDGANVGGAYGVEPGGAGGAGGAGGQ